MSIKSNLGLIGVGSWGINYVKTIEKIDESILKIIACKNLKNKPYLKKKYNVSDNWHDVTRSTNIEGIIIATPPKSHFEIAKEAIQNKKSIIIEKPVTLNSKDAKYLVNLALDNNVSVRVNHVYLYHPMYRFLKHCIAYKDSLNSIYTIAGNYGPFRSDVSPLWDWAPHDIAMCLDIMKEFPKNIKANFSKREGIEKNNKSNISINLIFKNSKFAVINIGNIMQTKTRFLKVNFENNSYIFDPLNFANLQEEKDYHLNSIKPFEKSAELNFSQTPLEILLNEFINDIRNSNSIIKDLILSEKVIKVIETIDKILKTSNIHK